MCANKSGRVVNTWCPSPAVSWLVALGRATCLLTNGGSWVYHDCEDGVCAGQGSGLGFSQDCCNFPITSVLLAPVQIQH